MHAGLMLIAISLFTIVNAMPLNDDMLLFWRTNNGEKCKPFTTYFIGCNKCVCSADGTDYCTRMPCFKTTNSLYVSEESMENEMHPLKPSIEKHRVSSHHKGKGNFV
ncbi:uncharacterized protein LOC118271306 [Spodoptera frugiperda]|uniref:Uncharacterized protein LOC118271306 n=1 Tax=Spodoptera frugiperda TaxID=7108 RepID=A0A9R0EM48_SPOFR|nr:uncharacterized protein LOC118271306 [Spodoptera frugiperda]